MSDLPLSEDRDVGIWNNVINVAINNSDGCMIGNMSELKTSKSTVHGERAFTGLK